MYLNEVSGGLHSPEVAMPAAGLCQDLPQDGLVNRQDAKLLATGVSEGDATPIGSH